MRVDHLRTTRSVETASNEFLRSTVYRTGRYGSSSQCLCSLSLTRRAPSVISGRIESLYSDVSPNHNASDLLRFEMVSLDTRRLDYSFPFLTCVVEFFQVSYSIYKCAANNEGHIRYPNRVCHYFPEMCSWSDTVQLSLRLLISSQERQRIKLAECVVLPTHSHLEPDR